MYTPPGSQRPEFSPGKSLLENPRFIKWVLACLVAIIALLLILIMGLQQPGNVTASASVRQTGGMKFIIDTINLPTAAVNFIALLAAIYAISVYIRKNSLEFLKLSYDTLSASCQELRRENQEMHAEIDKLKTAYRTQEFRVQVLESQAEVRDAELSFAREEIAQMDTALAVAMNFIKTAASDTRAYQEILGCFTELRLFRSETKTKIEAMKHKSEAVLEQLKDKYLTEIPSLQR